MSLRAVPSLYSRRRNSSLQVASCSNEFVVISWNHWMTPLESTRLAQVTTASSNAIFHASSCAKLGSLRHSILLCSFSLSVSLFGTLTSSAEEEEEVEDDSFDFLCFFFFFFSSGALRGLSRSSPPSLSLSFSREGLSLTSSPESEECDGEEDDESSGSSSPGWPARPCVWEGSPPAFLDPPSAVAP